MSPLLGIHIVAGALSVLAGAVALVSSKGKRLHRAAGSAFGPAMMVMALTAAILGGDIGNALAGGRVIYFVSTSWMTARRGDRPAGAFETAAFAVALSSALYFSWSAYQIAIGARPAINPYIVYATVFIGGGLALAALGDLSMVLRPIVPSAQRVARHLWRMCFALVIAVGSFAAQGASVLPKVIPGGLLLLGSMGLVLTAMFFWLVRVLFTRWYTPALA
jgi:hypothetical protein